MRAGLALIAACLLLLPTLAGALDFTVPAPATVTNRRDEALGSYQLPVGAWKDGQMKTLPVEGPLTRIAWRLQTTTETTLQILRPLRAQLIGQGFAVLYECSTQACGGYDFRYGMVLLPEPDMHVDLGDFRYLAAERP
ncbi:MAG: OmpA family protein, partial [Paracoccaceae bacterium]|nr:OmpA family protein [Paracoccaceae bacterium]